MDRIWASTDETSDQPRRTSAEDFALPSRGEAIVALRPALDAHAGPILLTGEPGVGKTWLCRRLQAELPPPWRWLLVDVPPANDPTTLYNLTGHRLGLPAASGADAARLALTDFLCEATADGVRWALVLDEAHNASTAFLEEVRILSNRLGRRDGFSALILVGQTALACRLAVRPLKALAARLSAHVHLRGLDVEEARTLLKCLAPTLAWDDRTLERQHRDAAGNPRRMLLAAAKASSSSTASASFRLLRPRPRVAQGSSRPVDPEPSMPSSLRQAATAARDERGTPTVGPYKAPLLVGDGMVEVGWDGGLEADAEPTFSPGPASEATPAAATAGAESTASLELADPGYEIEPEVDSEEALEVIETIDDHYAALQAWNEWARNRGRIPYAPASGAAAATAARPEPKAETGDDRETDSPQSPDGQSNVWVDGEQGFAPYGQLFSRLRQSRDVNESS